MSIAWTPGNRFGPSDRATKGFTRVFWRDRGGVSLRSERPCGGDAVVGFLHYSSPDKHSYLAEAVRIGLKETGYVEGRNLAIEYRWAEGHYDRLPAMAGDLVRRPVDVITAGGAVAAQAAKASTASVPARPQRVSSMSIL